MTWLQALLLGALQGLTEFLPVSSSGHLALAQQLVRRLGGSALPAPDSPEMILFDLCVHLGTVLAILVVFVRQFSRFSRSLVQQLPDYRTITSPKPPGALLILLLAVAACVPTALIGLGFQDYFESAFARPITIGLALLVTGGLLMAAELRPRPRRGWRRFGLPAALLVGIAQGLAITPGISRSGATICIAMLCGLKRRWAAQFSFLIAVPSILGASAIKLAQMGARPLQVSWAPILLGSAVAAVVGYLALRLLLAAVQRARLRYFAFYCWVVGLLAVAAGLTGYL